MADSAITDLIGRAWEASVALEGHGIEPDLQKKLDAALAALQQPEDNKQVGGEAEIDPKDCPEPFWHETHRYCPACSWREEVETPAEAEELPKVMAPSAGLGAAEVERLATEYAEWSNDMPFANRHPKNQDFWRRVARVLLTARQEGFITLRSQAALPHLQPPNPEHPVEGIRERLKSLLFGLHNGTAPDRDQRYQDAWRAGVAAATDAVLADLGGRTR